MFTLLSGLWRYMFQKEEYYILILGLDNVGKTVCDKYLCPVRSSAIGIVLIFIGFVLFLSLLSELWARCLCFILHKNSQ
jgi:hypothetical protein